MNAQVPRKLNDYFEARTPAESGSRGMADGPVAPVVVQIFTNNGWETLGRFPVATLDNLNDLARRRGARAVAVARNLPVATAWERNHRGVGVADFTLDELLAAPAAPRIERKGRPALTSHQRDLFLRLSPDRPRNIGSPSGMAHLVAKGYARRVVEYGPLGGEHYSYVQVP